MDTDTARFATELAKTVVKEVYGDVLSPAAKEVGGFLHDLARAMRFALPQIQMLAVDQDRYRRFLENSIERVPADQRIAPAPQLLGPTIEGIRFEPEGSMSDDAFSQLLSRAFDREKAGQAHPAFPALVRTLADDELLLLQRLRTGNLIVHIGTYIDGLIVPIEPSEWDQHYDFLVYPRQITIYANHLEALGVILSLVAEGFGPIEFGNVKAESQVFVLRLSDFGRLFVSAIFGDPKEKVAG